MKKIFTLLAGVLLAMGAQAETLIDFTQSKTIGITLGGTCESTTVNIHTNADSKDCIKFANGYTTDSELNGNYVTLTTDGGFKAGDVITIAGVFSNSDNSKQAAVSLFIMDTAEDHGYKVLWTTENFINGRTSADDPKEQTYTLEADADNLYLGRKGNTATNIIILKVVRGGEESTIGEPVVPAEKDGLIDFPTSEDGITLGSSCESTTVKIHTNTDSKDCIKLSSGYTTDSELNGNYVTLTTDGGFKAGDVITIAGVFSNSDESKQAAVSLFMMDTAEDHGYKVLWTTDNFINGRTSADDPAMQTYTLEADADNLYLGRKGNTATYITKLQVKRGTNGIQKVLPTTIENNAAIYNLQGQRVDASYRGVVIQNGKKAIQK